MMMIVMFQAGLCLSDYRGELTEIVLAIDNIAWIIHCTETINNVDGFRLNKNASQARYNIDFTIELSSVPQTTRLCHSCDANSGAVEFRLTDLVLLSTPFTIVFFWW